MARLVLGADSSPFILGSALNVCRSFVSTGFSAIFISNGVPDLNISAIFISNGVLSL
jgi:hypothetical protein